MALNQGAPDVRGQLLERESVMNILDAGHSSNPTLKARVEAYERDLILTALQASGWNQRRAADSLGVLPTTLFEKMRRLRIPHARERMAVAISGTGSYSY